MARRVAYKGGLVAGLTAFPIEGEQEVSADGEPIEKAVKSAHPDAPRCRKCAGHLLTHAESQIGIHIGCVAELQFRPKPLPGPRYGFNRQR